MKLLKGDKKGLDSGLKDVRKDPVSVTKITSISIIRSVCCEQDDDGQNPRNG